MKKSFAKAIKITRSALFLIALSICSDSFADCIVYVGLCPANPALVQPLKPIFDTFQGAAIDSNRCLKRAREYQAYCATPPHLSVTAFFLNSSGAGVVAAGVTGDSLQLYSVDVMSSRWIPLTIK